MSTRAGIGFDIHRFAPGRPLILAGIQVPGEQGLAGHSDADVVCHAVIDALLGAIADGDIGVHFPDSDERWRGARSLELLAVVRRRVEEKGWAPFNVDVTILAEKPRIAPWAEKMRAELARALELTAEQVSIKATTMEALGAIGRGEGIAALAVTTVVWQQGAGEA
ncbi:MAG: 2-C-methyl-D-erythritol 2,4-cyclodiphosphate synthase [Kiritimatiellia bacterium]